MERGGINGMLLWADGSTRWTSNSLSGEIDFVGLEVEDFLFGGGQLLEISEEAGGFQVFDDNITCSSSLVWWSWCEALIALGDASFLVSMNSVPWVEHTTSSWGSICGCICRCICCCRCIWRSCCCCCGVPLWWNDNVGTLLTGACHKAGEEIGDWFPAIADVVNGARACEFALLRWAAGNSGVEAVAYVEQCIAGDGSKMCCFFNGQLLVFWSRDNWWVVDRWFCGFTIARIVTSIILTMNDCRSENKGK